MTKTVSPQKSANDLTVVLKTVFGAERFPVDVKMVAREFTAHRYPEDPITMIRGADLPGFEGALMPAPPGKKGWGILYNNKIASPGRINFTLAHEFGHYLLHRVEHPKGFQCSGEDMANWDTEFGQLEQQANTFAAALLMPLDDFRQQISPVSCPTLDELGSCADRYAVSLLAAVLRWLQYTASHSVLVVSRDGFIKWARSSKSALKSGLFHRTRKGPAIEIPLSSLAAQRRRAVGHSGCAEHGAEVWLGRPCTEHVLFSERHDFTISLLHFADDAIDEASAEYTAEDTLDRMMHRTPGQSWFD